MAEQLLFFFVRNPGLAEGGHLAQNFAGRFDQRNRQNSASALAEAKLQIQQGFQTQPF